MYTMRTSQAPYAGQLFSLNGKTFMVTDRACGNPKKVVVRALANRNKLEEIAVEKLLDNVASSE